MLGPMIHSRIEKPDVCASLWICGVRASRFLKRTRYAGKGEIVYRCRSVLRAWMHMIDVKRGFLRGLRQLAVLAQISGSFNDLTNKSCGNMAAHFRPRSATSARSFISDSMSDNSVKA